MSELLDSTETGQFLRRPQRTLADWRRRRIGPPFVRIGRRVLYRRAELEAFVEAHLIQTNTVDGSMTGRA